MNDKTSHSVSNQPQSYVDSYQPPSNIAPKKPVANSAGTSKSDPLVELERLLKEYEAKEKNSKSKPMPTTKKSTKSTSDFASKLSQLKKSPVVKPQAVKSPMAKPQAAKPKIGKPAKVSESAKPRDPLKELEEALKKYEKRKGQAKLEAVKKSKPKHGGSRPKPKLAPKPVVKLAPKPVNSPPAPKKPATKKDPLVELEKLLAEYDRKSATPKTPPHKPAPKPASRPQPKFERVADNQVSAPPKTPPPPLAPIPSASAPTSPASIPKTPATPESNQSIEEQNIFDLLGVASATDQEKEAFLDELQEAIWEDFLDKDLELLVAANELKQLRDLHNQVKQNPQDNQLQEKLVNEVEKLIPDVEEIMLEKALELKEDMIWERIAGMKEYYTGRAEAIQKLEEAEMHFKKGHWQMGTSILNTLTP